MIVGKTFGKEHRRFFYVELRLQPWHQTYPFPPGLLGILADSAAGVERKTMAKVKATSCQKKPDTHVPFLLTWNIKKTNSCPFLARTDPFPHIRLYV